MLSHRALAGFQKLGSATLELRDDDDLLGAEGLVAVELRLALLVEEERSRRVLEGLLELAHVGDLDRGVTGAVRDVKKHEAPLVVMDTLLLG